MSTEGTIVPGELNAGERRRLKKFNQARESYRKSHQPNCISYCIFTIEFIKNKYFALIWIYLSGSTAPKQRIGQQMMHPTNAKISQNHSPAVIPRQQVSFSGSGFWSLAVGCSVITGAEASTKWDVDGITLFEPMALVFGGLVGFESTFMVSMSME